MARKILVRKGVGVKLAQACGCAKNTVYTALNGMENSELQILVRQRALKEYGGKLA